MPHTSTAEVSFHWADYVVFAASLALSLFIGLFFCLYGKRQSTNEQFLMGGRDLNPISVGLSMLGSLLNAVFLIGVPAEIHFYGIMYSVIGVSWIPAVIIAAQVFIPVFRKMEFTSAYQYLGVRFNSVIVQMVGAIVFAASILLFLAVLLYAPSLAFAQVTGISIDLIQIVCGCVCALYVVMGGLKAVVWTDTVQMIIMIAGTIIIVAIGADKVGGVAEVWRIAEEDNRINFDNLSPDPTVRHTIWTQIIGQFFIWLPLFGSNQMVIQRYHAVATTFQAQLSMYVMLIAVWLILILVTISGLVMHAMFRDCDPFASSHRRVSKPDQLFPLLIMEVLGPYRGLAGLYTAAVFAAALSSVSSSVNSLTAVLLEDFIKPIYTYCWEKKLEEKPATWISKILSLFIGLLTIALSYAAPAMGNAIVQIPLTIWGVVGAPLFGMFILAMFFPCANAVGTVTGILTSLIFAFWWSINGIYNGRKAPLVMPLGIKCLADTNSSLLANTTMAATTTTLSSVSTVLSTTTQAPSGVTLEDFYSVSYGWYGLVNLVICIVVGLLVSLFTDGIYYGCKRKGPDISSRTVYNCGDKCCCCCPKIVRRTCQCNIDHEHDEQVVYDSTLEKKGLDNSTFNSIELKENPPA